MPGTYAMQQMQEILDPQVLAGLLREEDLIEILHKPHSLLPVVDRVMPDLDRSEREWLERIPKHVGDAVRAVIVSVATGDDGKRVSLQYEPAYAFGVFVYEYDETVVIRVSGPDYA